MESFQAEIENRGKELAKGHLWPAEKRDSDECKRKILASPTNEEAAPARVCQMS